MRQPDGYALVYRNLTRPQHRGAVAAREHCEEMWAAFHPLADRNFLERLLFEFHQRCFEMYLGASLVSAGIDVRAPKPGPDFEVSAGGQRIFIEAVAATPGNPEHADAVSEPVYRDAEGRAIAVEVPHDRITLRIASAVRAKLDVFDRYRSKGLVAADDACIVAVNLRDIPSGPTRRSFSFAPSTEWAIESWSAHLDANDLSTAPHARCTPGCLLNVSSSALLSLELAVVSEGNAKNRFHD
jgi:hypothetical protein